MDPEKWLLRNGVGALVRYAGEECRTTGPPFRSAFDTRVTVRLSTGLCDVALDRVAVVAPGVCHLCKGGLPGGHASGCEAGTLTRGG